MPVVADQELLKLLTVWAVLFKLSAVLLVLVCPIIKAPALVLKDEPLLTVIAPLPICVPPLQELEAEVNTNVPCPCFVSCPAPDMAPVSVKEPPLGPVIEVAQMDEDEARLIGPVQVYVLALAVRKAPGP